jgi:hypothetical protein
MRPPRLRPLVPAALAAGLVACGVVGPTVLLLRWSGYRAEARHHARLQQGYAVRDAAVRRRHAAGELSAREAAEEGARLRRWAVYHLDRRRRYEAAAARPWLPVPPDPPPE